MWPHQVQHTEAKFPQVETGTWEDLYDSGTLESQLNRMRVSGQPPVPAPLVSQPHLLMTQPPPAIRGCQPQNGYPRPSIPPAVIPPAVIPPGQRHRYQRPPPVLQQRTGSTSIRPRVSNSVPLLFNKSVPPPRLPPHFTSRPAVVLQRPSSQTPPKTSLTDADKSSPFATSPAVSVKVEGEDEHRTLYAPPMPKVKILKRPSSTPSNLSSQGSDPEGTNDLKGSSNNSLQSKLNKSLKQREEEYVQARLRILGSAGVENDN